MSSTHTLTAEPRKLTGRKVKALRKQGLTPANIFGSHVKSTSIQVDAKNFLKLYQSVGDTGIIELTIEGEKKPRHTMVHHLQAHPVSGDLIHVDLREVDLAKKITAHVPVELTGDSPAVKQGGILTQPLDEVEIEALPTDFPEKIEIDISGLAEVGHTLHVSDLEIDTSKLSILTDMEAVIATVEAPKAEEEEKPEAKPEDVEATAEKGEAEKKEGETKDEEKTQSKDQKPAGPETKSE